MVFKKALVEMGEFIGEMYFSFGEIFFSIITDVTHT
jgi:hypothetical protein